MSTIIKKHSGGAVGATFQFADLAAEARSHLERARAEAERILDHARSECVAIRARAEQEGRRAADAAIEKITDAKSTARIATVLPALRVLVDELTQARDAWRSHWEQQAVHLAAAMARRIVRRELIHQPTIPLGLVSEALELAAGKDEIRILLHPEDHRTLGDEVGRLAAEVSRLAPADIVADASVTPGGCRVETRHGTIDQTFEAQLGRIEQELT